MLSENQITESQFEQVEKEILVDIDEKLRETLRGDWQERLESQDYEETQSTLKEIQALNEWRANSRQSPFKDFYRFFEAAGDLNRQFLDPAEQIQLRQALVDQLIGSARSMSPRVRDIYQALLADSVNQPFEAEFPVTEKDLQELKEAGDLDLLLNPDIPYSLKHNRFQTRFQGLLGSKKSRDLLDKQKEQADSEETVKDQQPPPQMPPEASDESLAQSYEREKGEGGPVYFTIIPGFVGYYPEQRFDQFDSQRNIWQQSQYLYQEPKLSINQEQANLLQGAVRTNQWTRLPKSYQRGLIKAEALSGEVQLQQDQNGDYVFKVKDDNVNDCQVKIYFSVDNSKARLKNSPIETVTIASQFSSETANRLEEIRNTKKGNLAKARALAGWTMRRLKYPPEGKFDQTYQSYCQDQEGYIEAIDRYRLADCKVANTYFAGLCSALDVPVRHVTGHMVKGKNQEGNSEITSGTGHAWSEVWNEEDNIWIRVDATPPGDPLLEEAEENEAVEGDFGEKETLLMTDEELEKLQEKFEQQLKELEAGRQTPEAKFAEEAGCTIEEAGKIIDKIKQLKVDYHQVLAEAQSYWKEIVKASLREKAVPRGTVPMSKSKKRKLIDATLAGISLATGDFDPEGFSRERRKQIKLKVFGGFEVYLATDLSGSMNETIEGVKKSESQRDMAFLLIDSVMNARQEVEDKEAKLLAPLPTKISLVVFGQKTEIVLPLTDQWGNLEQLQVYRALDAGADGGTPDDQALAMIEGQIAIAQEEEKKALAIDPRLKNQQIDWTTRRFVSVIADGGSNNQAAVEQLVASLRQNGATVDLFLITPKEDLNAVTDAQKAYGQKSVIPVNHPQELAKRGIRQLTNNLKKAYIFEES